MFIQDMYVATLVEHKDLHVGGGCECMCLERASPRLILGDETDVCVEIPRGHFFLLGRGFVSGP